MNAIELLSTGKVLADRLLRAVVVTPSNGVEGVVVVCEGDEQSRIVCDVLETGSAELDPQVDDSVLVWRPIAEESRGVILGRIRIPGLEMAIPRQLLVQAKECLTLRVGDGSITIRADGKILIKGKDLVSHARRVNRIKGGSVAIN